MSKPFKITQAKNKRFTLEREDLTYSLHSETVIKHQLLIKKTLSDETLKTLLKDDRFFSGLEAALKLLSKKSYAKARLIKALNQQGFQSVSRDVAHECEVLGYINEAKTLELLMEEYIEVKRLGPREVKRRLDQLGFKEDAILEALALYKEAKVYENAALYVEGTVKQYPNLPKAKLKEKIMQKLYTKGFFVDEVEGLIEEKLSRVSEDDEEALLKEAIQKLSKRYSISDAKERQRLIQKLLRDGYNYASIKKCLK